MAKGRPKTGATVKVTGVALEPALVNYLDVMARKDSRSRSSLINHMIKQHAQANGIDIMTFIPQDEIRAQ